MGKDKYNAAIVGCGRIASLFDSDPKRKFISTHAGAYKASDRINLIAASDVDEKKLKDFGERWQVTRLYKDYHEMLKREHIDILSICTWTRSHFEVTKASAASGVKAIFCEKPISDNINDAEKMVNICGDKGIILAINYRRRWDKLHQEIKRFIDDGGLGNIQGVSAYYAGGLANTASHLLDTLLLFFGDVQWVWAHFKKPLQDKDPDADGYLYFKKGFGCTVQAFDASKYMMFEIDIYGEKGRIRIENIGNSSVFWKVIPSPEFSESRVLSKEAHGFSENTLKEVMVGSINDIIGCLDDGKQPMSTGATALRSLELMSAFYKSNSSGRAVALPLKDKKTHIITK